MRIQEIICEVRDLSGLIEDDTDHEAIDILLTTLRTIQLSADHAAVPKISVEALINLVKEKPGGESFNLDALKDAKENNEAVKNIVGDIKDNESGIKYVFINPIEQDEESPEEGNSDSKVTKTAPEKTVSSMAKRAASSRK